MSRPESAPGRDMELNGEDERKSGRRHNSVDELEGDGAQDVYSVFASSQKRWISYAVCVSAMFSGLSSFIYYPALTSLSRSLHVSIELINLSITSYLMVSGVVPSLLGDMADQTGRRPVSLVALTLYFAANVGLALQDNYAALLILRCVQSAGASGREMQLWCPKCNLTRAFMLTWYDLISRNIGHCLRGYFRHCSASGERILRGRFDGLVCETCYILIIRLPP